MKRLDKKIFGTLFFSIFCAVTGVGIVVPLLPIYAHSLGATGFYIAMIFGVFSLSRTFLLPWFGRLSDKKGRKPFIITGLFVYSVISFAFIFSKNIESLIALRFVQGIGSAMIMPATQAYVGDITPVGTEGVSMSLFNMSTFMSMSVGPLLGGVINEHLGLQTSFACMGLLSLTGFFMSLFLLPPTGLERAVTREGKSMAWSILLKDSVMAALFLFRLGYSTCIGVIWSFLPIFADSKFFLSSSRIGILVMLGVFTSGLMHTPMGFLSDRVNRKIMAVIGGLIAGGAIFYIAHAEGFNDLFWGNILFGLGGGICMPPIMALSVLKGNKTEAMGSVMGLMTMAHSMGMLFGAFLGGFAMDLLQLSHAFSFGSIFMICGVLFFFISTYNKRYPIKVRG